jgi:HSP20 family protein
MSQTNDRSSPATTRAARLRVSPSFEAFEGPDALLFRFDVPGVADDGLSLRFEAGRLELDAASSLTAGWAEPLRYVASLALPEGTDADAIDASLSTGVLTVKVSKSPALRTRWIDVKTVS